MHKLKISYLLVAALLLSLLPIGNATAQFQSNGGLRVPQTPSFTDVNAAIPGAWRGSTVWGDYNNDGHLDIASTGETSGNPFFIANVYQGDGQDHFTIDSSTNFTATNLADIVWGDYNNDGNLDLAHMGDSAGDQYITRIYTGDGTGNFPQNVAANIGGALAGGLAWGDFTNDGAPDLLTSGQFLTGTLESTRLYRSDGQGHFAYNGNVNNIVGKVAVADYNNDGNLDFAVSSDVSSNNALYRGDGHGGFTLEPNFTLPNTSDASVAWGDYNGDGNLDLLQTGGFSPSTARIYAGDGQGHFIFDAQANNLYGIALGAADWGDYNNDGKLDILLVGMHFIDFTHGYFAAKVYAGDGQGGFSEDIDANLTGADVGNAEWGDYNSDGKLDILLMGQTGSGLITRVYRNDTASPTNNPPTAPAGLSASIVGTNTVQLSWSAASDDHTPAASLSYNLRVGSTPGASDVVGPMADAASGLRRVPALGNTQLNRHATLTGLSPNQTYYWSVQAIDGGYIGGAWASEGSFTIGSLGTATPTPTAAPSTATATPAAPTATSTPIAATATATLTPPAATATISPIASDTPAPPTATATLSPIASDTPAPSTATATAAATQTPTDCADPFTDLDGNIFRPAVHYLYCWGIVNGVDATHYGPSGSSTRAQFAKVVVLGFGIASYTPATPTFTDVPSSYFAYSYIESGYHAGILSGFDAATCAQIGTTFPCYGPNRAITRAQLTKLVVGAAGYTPYTPTQPTFGDVPPSNVFYVSIETAHHMGIINGYADNTFRPNNNIRRDEMAQVVYKGITTP